MIRFCVAAVSIRSVAALALLAQIVVCLNPLKAQTPTDEGWIGELNDIVAREIVDKRFPSFALVLVDREGIIAEVAQGYLELGGREPVTPSSLFRTGSVGKTLTDLAVMAAWEQGKVDLDADIRTYLPDFYPDNSFKAPITLRHLMTHRAGLVREPPIGNYFDASSPSLKETVESLNATSLLWEPGTRTKYSNAGLAVVGRVLEAVYGHSFSEVLEAMLFQPAGMTNARVGFSNAMSGDLAQGIMWQPNGGYWDAPVFDLGMSPAGDLYMSVRDMAALMTVLLKRDGRIVRKETLEEMWTPQFVPPRQQWHLEVGLGFSLNGKFAGKYKMARNGGAVYGYATELALLPEEGLGVYAVAAKDMSNGTVQAIAHWALQSALARRGAQPPPHYELSPEPFSTLPAKLADCSTESDNASLDRYLGRYGWDHNPLIICQREGRLYALIEWFFLYPLSEVEDDVFTFPSWALYNHEQLRFVADKDNGAAAILGYGSAGIRFPKIPGVEKH